MIPISEEEINKIFSRRLKYYLNKYEMSQKDLANRLGVSPTTVSNWTLGRKSPRMNKVDAMCNLFHCKRSDMIEEPKIDSEPHPRKGVTIKVLGHVAAGIPIEAIEDVIDEEEIPEEMARKGEYFGLKIKGDSMEPLIADGDIVIVKKQDDAENDDIVIAIINGDDGCCKKFRKFDGGVMLISLNSKYEPLVFTHADIDTIPVRVAGKVVELRRKLG